MSKSFTEKIAADKNPYPVSLPGFGMSVDFGDRLVSCLAAPPSGEHASKGHSDSGQQLFAVLLRFFSAMLTGAPERP